MIIDYRPDAAPNTAKLSGDQENYPQLFNDLYSPHNFSIDFSIAMCYIVFWKGQWLKSRRLNIHTEVTLWLLLLPTSACPAVPAQLSALLKRSTWVTCTTLSTRTSAWSAAPARLSALLRRSFRSNSETTRDGIDRPVCLNIAFFPGRRGRPVFRICRLEDCFYG